MGQGAAHSPTVRQAACKAFCSACGNLLFLEKPHGEVRWWWPVAGGHQVGLYNTTLTHSLHARLPKIPTSVVQSPGAEISKPSYFCAAIFLAAI